MLDLICYHAECSYAECRYTDCGGTVVDSIAVVAAVVFLVVAKFEVVFERIRSLLSSGASNCSIRTLES